MAMPYVSVTERFAVALRTYRRRAQLTQQDLAARSRVSLAAIRDLEQQRSKRPRPATIVALADALHLSTDERDELLSMLADADMNPSATVAGSSATLSVLGPLHVQIGERAIRTGTGAQWTLLGLLALHPNTRLSKSEIIDVIWPQDPPPSAVGLVHTYVGRLRRLLAAPQPGDGLAIVSHNGGYRLDVTASQLDLMRFRALVTEATKTDAAHSLDVLSQALDLWRGEPLNDIEALRDHASVAALRQERLTTVLTLADTADQLGRQAAVVPLLREFTDRHPLHEPLHARLMTALAKLGAQAQAIEVYESVRGRLAEQLGLDPTGELRTLHTRILRQELTPEPTPSSAITIQGPPSLAGTPVNGLIDTDPTTAEPTAGNERLVAETVRTRPDAHPTSAELLTRRSGVRSRRTALTVTAGTLVISALAGLTASDQIIERDEEPPGTPPLGRCSEPRNVHHIDGRRPGHTWQRDAMCHNTGGAPVYAEPDPARRIGVLDTTTSWFLCWQSGSTDATGNTIWYYTQGDRNEPGSESYGAWGYVPAAHLRVTTHPVPQLPRC